MLFSRVLTVLSLATLSLTEVIGTHTVVSVYTPVIYQYVTVYDDSVASDNKDAAVASSTSTSFTSTSSAAVSTSEVSGTTVVQPETLSAAASTSASAAFSSTSAASISSSTPDSSSTPATSTSSSTAASSTTSSTSSNTVYSGDGTFYEVGASTGACGQMHYDSEYVIAIGKGLYDSKAGSDHVSEYCGKKINAHYQGKSVQVTVVDRCEGCSDTSIDFSPSAFQQLASESAGRIAITWEWA